MQESASPQRPLTPKECRELADALPDTPETVIPVHLLTRGLCRAYLLGKPSRFDAAVVQSVSLVEEPWGLGTDHRALWKLLGQLKGWTCVDVSRACAPRLGALMREETGSRVCYYGDIYHTLTKPVARSENDDVRQLTPADLPLLEASGEKGATFGGLERLLADGFVAGAVVSGRVVATAVTGAITEKHGDIGVATDEAWRGRGFATSAASIVAQRIQETGRIPVWSCGEDNQASLRVAKKLGFEGVSRLTYVLRGDVASVG